MFAIAKVGNRARKRGTLLESDCDSLPRLSPYFNETAEVGRAAWEAECAGKRPSLRTAILKTILWPLLFATILSTFRGIGNAVVVPWLLSFMVDAVTEGRLTDAGRLLGFLLLERVLGASMEYVAFKFAGVALPTTVAMIVSDLVTRKAAKPGLMGLADAGVDPSALVGREVLMLHAKGAGMLASGVVSLVTIVSGCITLFSLLGWPAVFGSVWLICTIRAGIRVQDYAKRADGKMSIAATERLQILNNAIGAIKAIKYFAWEPEFLDSLVAARRRESMNLKIRQRWSSTAAGIGKVTPVTGSLVTFVAYALLGYEIRASTIFAANTVFMTLRFSVGSISFLSDLWKSLELTMSRVEKWLHLPEAPPNDPLPEGTLLAETTDLQVSFLVRAPPADAKKGDQGKSTNKEIPAESGKEESFSLSVPGKLALGHSGKLTAICGLVGSGKTVLLTSLLNRVEADATVDGQARAADSIGFCPQKPFVITGTVLENILLGRPLVKRALLRCLQDSSLGKDLQQLKGGLNELIGERGTTLSGGQQIRLCLARAFYADPALLLLDDPLAAVDAEVGRALLHALRLRCAPTRGGQPPGAVVVLNQLPLLPNFDQIVFVKDGRVAAAGTFAELSQQVDFKAFIHQIDLQRRGLDDALDLKTAAEEAERVAKFCEQGLSDRGGSTTALVIKQETKASGWVSWKVWREYFFAPGRWFALCIVGVYVAMYVALILRDWWMSVWADAGEGGGSHYVAIFAFFSMVHVALVGVAVILLGSFAQQAGHNLHQGCIAPLMHAPMSYFDETPSGRITSRLGPDLATIDGSMAMLMDMVLTFVFMILTMSAVITEQIPVMGLVFVGAFCASLPVVKALAIVRVDTKRYSNNALAPVLSNLSDIRRGASLIQAMRCGDFFQGRHQAYTDRWALLIDSCNFLGLLGNVWCCCMHLVVLIATGVLTYLMGEKLARSPGLVAMYLSYAVLWGLFAMVALGVVMAFLTNGASLERLVEFKLGDLPSEAPWKLEQDPGPGAWPKQGAVRFESVCLRYRPDAPLALDELDLSIAGGEKLGIVGRTGAGKSSLTVLLFRLVECERGRVVIDGVDIAQLGLHTLRKAISMIPQEPLLMTGSVRYNLDPFGQHAEQQLQRALEQTGLFPVVKLDTMAGGAAGAGDSLSAGQKQLLTFGRTLLQDTRIVMMDEPTASVDMQTDRFVQQTSKELFRSRTVLTIAHRLETVRGCDRIAVLDAGKLAELGAPAQLLANKDSRLAKLAAAERSQGGMGRSLGALALQLCSLPRSEKTIGVDEVKLEGLQGDGS